MLAILIPHHIDKDGCLPNNVPRGRHNSSDQLIVSNRSVVNECCADPHTMKDQRAGPVFQSPKDHLSIGLVKDIYPKKTLCNFEVP